LSLEEKIFMAKKSTRTAISNEFASAPELICIAQPSAALRSAAAGVASESGASTDSLNSALRAAGAVMLPIFGSEPRVAASRDAVAAAESAELPALSNYYSVYVAPEKMAQLAQDLLNDPNVQGAYIKPPASPPIWLDDADDVANAVPDGELAPTASFVARQLYLEVAPGGIDARYAWTRTGGRGQGVRVIDIEGAWRFGHEDLLQNQGGVIAGTQSANIIWRNHGTAVVGVFGGDENAFGVTGIAPLANTRAISIFAANNSSNSAQAIRQAADALGPGDIILIELHRAGPDSNGSGQDGFIAVEWWPDDFAAVVYARSRGVIVIEAAGNGGRNFDAAIFNTRPAGFPVSWKNPFNLANPQSGAIIVGAGAPPPGTHGRDHGPDRSRLAFSNYGARVDVQGWGREVTTAGYGDLQGGANEDLWYTDTFSGTSSASPVVVGAVACMQGALRAANRPLLTPASTRTILRNTGSPQTDAPQRPATQRIGNRPNLRQALLQLLPVKGIKEKNKKIEIKETKELKQELKEVKIEKIEHKEFKELEHKQPKEKGEKEIFEKITDKLNDKFNEKLGEKLADKLGEKGFENNVPSDLGLAQRLTQLEQSVAALRHFIPAELRPDLSASALSQEPDVQAMQEEMQANASGANAMKNLRDTR
jgi:hypothetical protein